MNRSNFSIARLIAEKLILGHVKCRTFWFLTLLTNVITIRGFVPVQSHLISLSVSFVIVIIRLPLLPGLPHC